MSPFWSQIARELSPYVPGEQPRAADLVKLKFFAGLTLHEAATALGLPPRSADRLWAFARAWLADALDPG